MATPQVEEAISGEPTGGIQIPVDDVRLEGRMRPERTQQELEDLVKPRSDEPLPSQYLDRIKKLEGFNPVPFWDVKQWTVGWGTRAKGKDERPTVAELEQRFVDEVGNAAMVVDHVNPHLPEGIRAALTSLTYNTGARWVGLQLGNAVRVGDPGAIVRHLLTYANGAGRHNEAIARRRREEAEWIDPRPPAGIPNVRQAVHHHARHARQAPQKQRPMATGFRSYEPM